jgi:DNA-directed RNA polymerase subunit RPC12/RpoP
MANIYVPKEIICDTCAEEFDPREFGIDEVSDYETDEKVACPSCGMLASVLWAEVDPVDLLIDYEREGSWL